MIIRMKKFEKNTDLHVKILLIDCYCMYIFFHVNWNERNKMSRSMRFPTMWYVQPAKAQISLRICAVWSEPLLVA